MLWLKLTAASRHETKAVCIETTLNYTKLKDLPLQGLGSTKWSTSSVNTLLLPPPPTEGPVYMGLYFVGTQTSVAH